MANKWENLRNDDDNDDQFFSELNGLSKKVRNNAKVFAEALKKVSRKESRMVELIEALDHLNAVEIVLLDKALIRVGEALRKFANKELCQHPFGRHIPRKQSLELSKALAYLIESCGEFYGKNGEVLKSIDPNLLETDLRVALEKLNLD